MNKVKTWITKIVLVHTLKRVVKKVWRSMSKEEKMEFLKSKEQIVNILTIAASVASVFSAGEIASWFVEAAQAVSTGRLEVVLASVVTGALALSRFFSRLNRKKEAVEAVALVDQLGPVGAKAVVS